MNSYVVQKRRATDFEAPKLEKVPSGGLTMVVVGERGIVLEVRNAEIFPGIDFRETFPTELIKILDPRNPQVDFSDPLITCTDFAAL